jgi:hypothetical protein
MMEMQFGPSLAQALRVLSSLPNTTKLTGYSYLSRTARPGSELIVMKESP